MGTNFYFIPSVSESDKSTMEELLKNDEYEKLKSLIENTTTPIHLCKRSGGWKISWDTNNWKYYTKSKKSLEEFLQSGGKIEDEYGKEYTFVEFWKEMTSWDKDPHNYRFLPKYGEELVDGLRFCGTDFC